MGVSPGAGGRLTAHPKAERVEDRDYLAWCRKQACPICTREGRRQRLRTEAHHVDPKGMGGATLRDDRAAPACTECHMRAGGLTVAGLGPIAPEVFVDLAIEHRERYLAEKAAGESEEQIVPW